MKRRTCPTSVLRTNRFARRPARPGHPIARESDLTLTQLEQADWITVPPMVSVLRHRFELMFPGGRGGSTSRRA